MENIVKQLEKLTYKEEIPFFLDDILDYLEKLYYPQKVDDISNIGSNSNYTILIAINNKGYFSNKVKINDKVSYYTIDEKIKFEDLYYFEINISLIKPFVYSTFYKYLSEYNGDKLEVSYKPFFDNQKIFLEKLKIFANDFNLVVIDKEVLNKKINLNKKKIKFKDKYFSN